MLDFHSVSTIRPTTPAIQRQYWMPEQFRETHTQNGITYDLFPEKMGSSLRLEYF